MILYTVFIFSIINLSWCEQCKLNKRSPEALAEGRIEAYLQSCFQLTDPPVSNGSRTVLVKMNFLLQSFAFDNNEDTIILYSWNYYSWQDDRLIWKPEDFNDIKSTHISNMVIWNPGLKLVNNADELDYDVASSIYTKCKVNSTGEVKCVVRGEHKVLCSSMLMNWPYDTKTCVLDFAQWRLGESKVIFMLTHIKYVLNSSKNSGWQIIHSKVSRSAKTGVQSNVIFKLERLAEGLEATIVVPCFVMSSLTVTALLLDYKKDTRLGILSLSLITHFLSLNEVSIYIPKHSRDVPVVLVFISRSTVLTVLVFVLSFGFNHFVRKPSQPVWMSTFNDFILDGYGRYVVVTMWDVEDNNLANCKSREWTNFLNITNSFCLFIVIVTYICLFVSYMPTKTALGTGFVYI